MKNRWWLLVAFAVLFALFFILGLEQDLSLASIKNSQDELQRWRQSHPVLTGALFFASHVLITALSVPSAAIMSLAAGALFGLAWGTLIVSFAAAIGATLAFLSSRCLVGDWVQSRFGNRLAALNAAVDKDGGFYLFTLRLVPLVPFFLINLAMGLTRLRTWTFYWVSQAGMLAVTLVIVNAGTELAQIESLSDIMAPQVLGALALLGLFPTLTKKLIEMIRLRRR